MIRILAVFLGCLLWADLGQAQSICGARQNCCDFQTDPTCPGAVYDHHRLALVVGTDSYGELLEPLGIGPLDNAVNDALYIGDQLIDAGFSVRYLLEPDKARFKAEITEFAAKLGQYTNEMAGEPVAVRDEQLAVIYVAGHGFSVNASNEIVSENIILREKKYNHPPDNLCRIFKDSSTTTDFLRNTLSNQSQYPTVFLIDACRSLPDQLPACFSPGQTRGSGIMTPTRLDSQFAVRLHSTQFSTSKLAPAQDQSPVNGLGAYASQIGPLLTLPNINLAQVINLSRRLVPEVTPNEQLPSEVHNHDEQTRRPVSLKTGDDCKASEARLWIEATRCPAMGEECERDRICPSFFQERASTDTAACDYSQFAKMINVAAGRNADLKMPEMCLPYEPRITAATEASFRFKTQKPTFSALKVATDNAAAASAQTLAMVAQTAEIAAIGATSPDSSAAGNFQVSGMTFPANQFQLPPSLANQVGRNLQATTPRPAARPGSVNIAELSAETQRTILLTRRITADVGPPVQANDQFRLFVAPDDSSGQVLGSTALKNNTALRLDCVNIACGNGWVGVTAFSDGQYYRGFARPEAVVTTAPSASLEFPFDVSRPLQSDERQQVDALVGQAIEAKGFVQIAIVSGGSSDDTAPAEMKVQDRLALSSLEADILSVEVGGEKLRAENISQQIVAGGSDARKIVISLRVPRAR